ASRETRASGARALLVGRTMFPSVRRGEASRRRAASVHLRVSRLRLAYAPAPVRSSSERLKPGSGLAFGQPDRRDEMQDLTPAVDVGLTAGPKPERRPARSAAYAQANSCAARSRSNRAPALPGTTAGRPTAA